jgi:hypothetical protein
MAHIATNTRMVVLELLTVRTMLSVLAAGATDRKRTSGAEDLIMVSPSAPPVVRPIL